MPDLPDDRQPSLIAHKGLAAMSYSIEMLLLNGWHKWHKEIVQISNLQIGRRKKQVDLGGRTDRKWGLTDYSAGNQTVCGDWLTSCRQGTPWDWLTSPPHTNDHPSFMPTLSFYVIIANDIWKENKMVLPGLMLSGAQIATRGHHQSCCSDEVLQELALILLKTSTTTSYSCPSTHLQT